MIEMAIKNGSNVNIANKYGRSPLHLAAYNGHQSTAELLVQKGADINLKDHLDLTPLFMATITRKI